MKGLLTLNLLFAMRPLSLNWKLRVLLYEFYAFKIAGGELDNA